MNFHLFWKGPLSQWHKSDFVINNVTYNCCEQFMMSQKAILFGDHETFDLIMESKNPSEQKKLGRQVKNFVERDWNTIAREVVYRGNYAKFMQNENLLKYLLATSGLELVEDSPYDTIWGIDLSADDPLALSRETWRGKNWLGETLTRVRNDIQSELMKELKGF